MDESEAAAAIAKAVENMGLLLVHDQRLPSATALVAGGPVFGSWWSHPDATTIYNALGALEDRLATVKLVAGKLTLVAPRLWPDLVAIGSSQQPWQLDGLTGDARALLDRVAAADDPVLLDSPNLRESGKQLEERLLVVGEEVHTDEGHHLKALGSWEPWGAARSVEDPPDTETAMSRFESIVNGWEPDSASLLPWT